MKIKLILRDFRRRYREPVIRLLFRLFAMLPYSLVLKVGSGVGWILWVYNGEMRRVTEQNLKLCLPQLSEAERTQLARSSLLETGKTITEITTLWCKPQDRIQALITKVEGEEHITNAIEAGRGVILLAPHLGAWEVIGLYVSPRYPMTNMYRPPEMESLEDIVREGRTRFGSKLVPTDARGVRGLLSALRKNEVVGILPDQDPGRAGGEFAPFFGVQANTMTLASKIAQKTNADVIGCFARRKKDATGYEIYFAPANKKINDKNIADSLKALNEEVEKLILKCPEQYQWSYKRFKTRPQGEAKLYT